MKNVVYLKKYHFIKNSGYFKVDLKKFYLTKFSKDSQTLKNSKNILWKSFASN